jgi:hypothetical protein
MWSPHSRVARMCRFLIHHTLYTCLLPPWFRCIQRHTHPTHTRTYAVYLYYMHALCGSGICRHGWLNASCKEYGEFWSLHARTVRGCRFSIHHTLYSSSFAARECYRDLARCKECGRFGMCPHGQLNASCKEYGKSGICNHGQPVSADFRSTTLLTTRLLPPLSVDSKGRFREV